MLRLFTGIELPETVKDALVDLQQPLPGAKWVNDEDMHLTLRFAGDVDNRLAREWSELLGEIDVPVFEIKVQGLGAFGGNEPRTLWAGLAPCEPLEALARATERAARAAGLPAEARNFKAHVTLARLRNTPPDLVARWLGRHGALACEPFVVQRFVLFSSRPKVGGGPYVVEASYPLAGGYAGDWHEESDWQ
jgi:2'-5' RNA ligase